MGFHFPHFGVHTNFTWGPDFSFPTPMVRKPVQPNDLNHAAQGQQNSAGWVDRSPAQTVTRLDPGPNQNRNPAFRL